MRINLKRTIKCVFLCCVVFMLINLHIYRYTSWIYLKHLKGLNFLSTTENSSYNLNLSLPGLPVKETHRTDSELLWPSRKYYSDDRILNQLKYKPMGDNPNGSMGDGFPLKRIYLDPGLGGGRVTVGRQLFLTDKCLVNTCTITRDQKSADTADAVLFQSMLRNNIARLSPHQIWMVYILESPYHSSRLSTLAGQVNWTATYRHDSDIVAPYEKFVPYNESVKFLSQNKNYAAGKTKKVAWFVSNCGAANQRLNYAKKLSRYIQVDIYGQCGPLKCPRKNSRCSDMLNTEYKFYLSFENSNCRDYITEKFFVTGLQHNVIPIVMGAAPEDYVRAAPPHSFIHVDDFQSPEQLAQYLHKLDQNDDLYNEYFRWKGTGTFINTYFWCRVCAMLHDTSRESHVYRDLEKWWRGEGVCIGKDSWRQRQRTSKFIVEDYLL